MSTPPSAREIGQFSPAPWAAFWNSSLSIPGTRPRTVSCDVVTVGAPSTSSSVTTELTSRRSGSCPASPSSCESAIAKQEACAAATSSSGEVLPSERSVRDAHVTDRSSVAPLLRLSVPFPFARPPSHTVFAVRSAMAICALLGRLVSTCSAGAEYLLPEHLDDEPFGAASVELGVEDGLPRAEVEPPAGDRQDDLVVDEQVLPVCVAVVLAAAAVVAEVAGVGRQLARDVVGRLLPRRRGELVEPFERVLEDPRLVIVDPHAGGDVHRADEHHPLAHAGVGDGRLHVVGDAHELAAFGGLEGQVGGVAAHARSISARRGRTREDARPWTSNCATRCAS